MKKLGFENRVVIVAAVAALLLSTNAWAEDTNTLELIKQLQKRIDDLEQTVRQLQKEKTREQQESDAKAKQRIDELEKKLQESQQAQSAEEQARSAKAKEQADELDQKIKTLERNREVDQETAAEKAKSMPTVTLGANGLVVRSADSKFLMNVHGYIQADSRFYLNDNNPTDNTFLLRRVRPIVEGTVYDRFDYRLMVDFGSGNVTSSSAGNNALLDDAYVNARLWPQFQVQAGKYKSPVGLERLQSTAELLFIENGFATQLTPNYDLGAEVHNNLFNTPINYAIGIFNGANDASSDDLDTTDEGKDVVGRIFLQPFLRSGPEVFRKLGFGVGGSTGHHEGPLPSYRTPGQQTFFTYTNGVSADGELYRIDPQLFYYWGPFGILGEYAVSSQKVKSTAAGAPHPELESRAWQVEGSWFLTGDENSFRSTSRNLFVPLHPFTFGGEGWGALELVARGQRLTPDKDAFPRFATSASAKEATSWGVGLNWYLNSNLRLYLDYERTSFDGGSKAKGAVTAQDEQVLLGRVQVSF